MRLSTTKGVHNQGSKRITKRAPSKHPRRGRVNMWALKHERDLLRITRMCRRALDDN